MKKIFTVLFAALAGMLATSANAANGSTMAVFCTNLEQELKNLEVWITQQNSDPIPDADQLTKTNTSKATVTFTQYVQAPSHIGFITIQSTTPTAATITKTFMPGEAAQYLAARETSHNIVNTLTQVPFAMYNKSSDAANAVKSQITAANGSPYQTYLQQNTLDALTTLPTASASDTLYIADTTGKSQTAYGKNQAYLQKPTTLHNNDFDFAKLISEKSYSTAEEASAQQFLKYAANSEDSFTKNIHFSDLFSNSQALFNLKNGKDSATYKRYVFNLRSLLASRSMVTSAINNLIAERTPMQGLGAAAGITTANASASPLQVEAYRATHRIEDPTWYTSIANAKPATVEREILVVLAEIEYQNYEAHLDRERIEGELAASALQGAAQANANFMLQEAPQMNTAIENAIKDATPATSTTTSTAGSQSPQAVAGSSTSTNSQQTNATK